MSRSLLERFWALLYQRSVLALVIVFALASLIIFAQNSRVTTNLVRATAIQDAALYAESIAEFRTLYTSEVVARFKETGGKVTHDYDQHPGAIPLPATLSMLLGRRIGELHSGAETRLYSDFPFPYKGRLGLRDKFAKEAWKTLRQEPDKPFHRFDQMGGKRVLRYAIADKMRASCIDCHNSHPDTPEIGWKEGDVRGVLEVILPMDQVESATRAGMRGTLLLMVFMTIVGVAGLAVVIGRLKQTSSDLAVRVEEGKASADKIHEINEQLVGARDVALAASEAKSQFLANMSHELRTPLNAIIGYSEMLQEEVDISGQDELKPDLEKIRESGVNLLAIISDILDIANVDTGVATLNPEEIEVSSVMEDGDAMFRPAAEDRDNSFEAVSVGDLEPIYQDRSKLLQCLRHMLSNACKFTSGGQVKISVEQQDSMISFRVSDTGIGMSEDDLKDLFAPFAQADTSSTRQFGGAGLGLSITKRFCELMGGSLSVSSKPQEGSTFTMLLPCDVRSLVDETSMS